MLSSLFRILFIPLTITLRQYSSSPIIFSKSGLIPSRPDALFFLVFFSFVFFLNQCCNVFFGLRSKFSIDVIASKCSASRLGRFVKKNNHKFRHIAMNTSQYMQSFFPKIIIPWNLLSFTDSPSLENFRYNLFSTYQP